jgi:hypothetical protein
LDHQDVPFKKRKFNWWKLYIYHLVKTIHLSFDIQICNWTWFLFVLYMIPSDSKTFKSNVNYLCCNVSHTVYCSSLEKIVSVLI